MLLDATTDHFGSRENLIGLLTNTSVWTILALASAVVIIAGGIDISIGALLALAAGCCGLILKLPGPPGVIVPMGIAAALAVGTTGGMLNAASRDRDAFIQSWSRWAR